MLGHVALPLPYLVDMLILAPKNRRKIQQLCQLITHINSLLEKDPNRYIKEKKIPSTTHSTQLASTIICKALVI